MGWKIAAFFFGVVTIVLISLILWAPQVVMKTVEIEMPKIIEKPVTVERVEFREKVIELPKVVFIEKTIEIPAITTTAAATAPTPVPPTVTPIPTAVLCLFDLRKPIRGLPGVSITNDRSDWDGKANGLVSYVIVKECSKASFLFERWGPPGSWTNLEETYEATWGSGEYNLQELFYLSGLKDLNDTLQIVQIQPGGTVELREHDRAPWGIKILLSCPADPS